MTTLADRHLEVGGPIHRALLEAIGANPAAEGLADTPRRVAATLAELLTPCPSPPPPSPTTRATTSW